MRRIIAALLLSGSSVLAQAPAATTPASQSAEPALPSSLPADARMYRVLMLGNPAGQQDPTLDVANLRRVRTVIKDGRIYDTRRILEFLGVKP